ncbi:MAG: R2-like ligand-binding oxidase [Chloroflexi bacterium]|nr:R2-like ligand-binding oxidase [Chloroflexota bacterium]
MDESLSARGAFVTTTRGLDRSSPPMRLFEKAKRFGVWNPSTLDLTQDKQDWANMTPDEQRLILHLTSLFQGGEEAVTLDLLPLIMTIASEGRIEEEMFLTTFLWEEAKHTDFFSRFLEEVTGQVNEALSAFHSDPYRAIFYEALPEALQALRFDQSPKAQVRASVVYNMIVEGMLAETGYHAYFQMLERNDLMPGLREGIRLLKQDESRHIAYGIYLISRLVVDDENLWAYAAETMTNHSMQAMAVVSDIFAQYDPVPFGLQESEFMGYAMMQYQKRFARIEKAQGSGMDELRRLTSKVIDEDDA